MIGAKVRQFPLVHEHPKLPAPKQRWMLQRSSDLKDRGVSGSVVTVKHVHHCNGPEHCYAIVSHAKRSAITVPLRYFAFILSGT
jgi:hypothetical protein